MKALSRRQAGRSPHRRSAFSALFSVTLAALIASVNKPVPKGCRWRNATSWGAGRDLLMALCKDGIHERRASHALRSWVSILVDGIAFFATLLVILVRRRRCCCYEHKVGDALCIAIIGPRRQ